MLPFSLDVIDAGSTWASSLCLSTQAVPMTGTENDSLLFYPLGITR